MRLFIAVELSPEARRHLAGVQAQLRAVAAGPSWTPPEKLHLTLKFLGELAGERVPEVCASLQGVTPGGALELRATRVLCFPAGGPIRIIGAEIADDAGRLASLQARIEDTCATLGFPRENRAYRPHVTLARARRPLPGAMRKTLAEASASAWPGPVSEVGEFMLIQSVLDSKGAQYTPVARRALAETAE